MTSVDTPNAISSQGSAVGVSPSAWRCGATIDLFGQEAAPASPSAAQESKKAIATSATYGRIGQGSFASVGLQRSLESRLQAQLPLGGWMKFSMIWKRKRTPALRQYCQLAVSASHINGTGSGLWHSPRSTMIMESVEGFRARMNAKRPNDRKEGTPNLAVQALWATPNTMDHLSDRSQEAKDRQFSSTRKGRTSPANLREQVSPSMWPTPNAGDDRDRGRWENPCIQKRVREGKQINLSMIAQGSAGFDAPMEKQGQLNPGFVCWLMGYSTAHLSSMLLAMQSYRKSRRNSSKPTWSAAHD